MKAAAVTALPVRELCRFLTAAETVGGDGAPLMPLVFVDLDGAAPSGDLASFQACVRHSNRVLIGVSRRLAQPPSQALLEGLACTLTAQPWPGCRYSVLAEDLELTCGEIQYFVDQAPRAAMTLQGVLRVCEELPIRDGLLVESLAYSMLLGGREFTVWRAKRQAQPQYYRPTQEPVLIQRNADVLELTLNCPERHNAFGRDMRDALVHALELPLADATLAVRLSGNGPSFCSGGDLQEFGLATDPAAAHLIRMDRSVASLIAQCSSRVEVRLHGATIGAGLELASFAGLVVAQPGTWFRLPELAMGLIPGAGGCVGVSRRIGRWRTAFMALSGCRVELITAREWGLVDA